MNATPIQPISARNWESTTTLSNAAVAGSASVIVTTVGTARRASPYPNNAYAAVVAFVILITAGFGVYAALAGVAG